MLLDYKIAYSKDSECTESLDVFSPADASHQYPLSLITVYVTKQEVEQYKDLLVCLLVWMISSGKNIMLMLCINSIMPSSCASICGQHLHFPDHHRRTSSRANHCSHPLAKNLSLSRSIADEHWLQLALPLSL